LYIYNLGFLYFRLAIYFNPIIYVAAQIGPHLLFHATGITESDRLLRESFHHRPDTPWIRRKSSPEIIEKVRLALKEMCAILDDSAGTSSCIYGVTRQILYLRPLFTDLNFDDTKSLEEHDNEDNNDNDWFAP
jgi:hypothetical protein